MPANTDQIIGVITGLIPEVMAFIKQFHTSTGTLPTDQDVINHMNANANRIVAISDAWLASHPQNG